MACKIECHKNGICKICVPGLAVDPCAGLTVEPCVYNACSQWIEDNPDLEHGAEAWTEPMQGTRPRAEQLAEDHWNYIREVILREQAPGLDAATEEYVEHIGWHYKTAMIHGYKHGLEDAKEGR